MKTTDHHLYSLDHLEGPGHETLQFVHKQIAPSPEGKETGVMETVANGTTNEEVIRVVIDRIRSQNEKFPCRENAITLTHIETALLWMEQRTRERKARGVEGKALK